MDQPDECGIGSEDFLRRLHAGDRHALTELVEEAGPRIMGHIWSLVGDDDDADDLYQECWVHVMQQIKKCTRPKSIVGWTVVTSANYCRSMLRKRSERPVSVGLDAIAEIADTHPGVERELECKTTKQIVWNALESLTERQRAAVVLTLLEGRSNAEAAVVMKTSSRSVQSLAASGVRELQKRHDLRTLFQEMHR